MRKSVLNPKIKCIALDLDRTTLRSDGTLSHRTRKALEDAIKGGVEVVIVSGRAFDSLPEEILQISGIRYVSTSNGAAVYEITGKVNPGGNDDRQPRVQGKKLHGWNLEPEDVDTVLNCAKEFFEQSLVTYEVFVDGVAFAPSDYVADPVSYGIPERAVAYTRSTRRPVQNILSFVREHKTMLESMDLIFKDSRLYQPVEKLLRERVEGIYLTSSVEYRLEISHRDGGKASGLRYILERLALQPEETIAFGDGDNDADMLQFAGIGAAVKNATPRCIACADVIVGSNDSDGVAEMIEQILSD